MIYNAALVVDLFDYLSMQCTEEANDLIVRLRVDIEYNEVKPEDLGIKNWEPKELTEDLNEN